MQFPKKLIAVLTSLSILAAISATTVYAEEPVGALNWNEEIMTEANSVDTVSFEEVQKREADEIKKLIIDRYLADSSSGSSYHNRVVDFIKKICIQAHNEAYNQDIYPSVLIAQAIVESNAGKSGLSDAPNYNLFGIKGTYNGQSVNMATFEDAGDGSLYNITAGFRKYPSYTESISDYVTLIKGMNDYYSGSWRSNTTSYQDATLFLTGRYATATNYNTVLNEIIETYNLTRFDEPLTEFTLAWVESASYSVADIEEIVPAEMLESYNAIPERFTALVPNEVAITDPIGNSYTAGSSVWFLSQRVAQSGRLFNMLPENIDTWDLTSGNLKMRLLPEITQGSIGVIIEEGLPKRLFYVEAFTETEILISEGGPDLPLSGVYRVIDRKYPNILYISC